MTRCAAIMAIFAMVAGHDEEVSLLQSIARTGSREVGNSTAAVPFDWAVGGLADLVSNTLTSAIVDDQEMRFGNVGTAHMASGDVSVDLVIKCVDGYKKNARTGDNGRHTKGSYGYTEFGRIFVRINSANRFKFMLVQHGTDIPVTATAFDFLVLDMDQACNDASCYCDEEVIVWGSTGYYTVDGAYSDFSATSSNYEKGPSGTVACANVTINDGFVTDPSGVKTLSASEAKASIVFHFADTAEWEVGFVVKEHGPRALVFGGAANPFVPPYGHYHEHPEVHWEQEVLPDHGMAYEWKLDRECNVTYNNLGGRGPNFEDPHEIRFANVGELYFPDQRRSRVSLDLVVYTEDRYWGSDYINTHWNGANGEYGEIGLSRRSEANIIFSFVEHGTYIPRVVPFFDFTIFDIDNMADPNHGEEYTVYGASEYAALDNCFTIIDDSKPGETKLKSWVTENGGAIENPSSWVDLSELQLRAAVQFRFFDTATWKVHFKITATSERAFLFGGRSRPPLSQEGTLHPIQTLAPTKAPTSSPTPPTGPTVYGDPHVTNVKGEAFDINRATFHTFLVVPRASDAASVKLQVVGHVTPRGALCTGQLYLTNLTITGQWVGRAKQLELFTSGEDFNTPKAIGLRIGSSGDMSVEEFTDRMPFHMAKVTAFNPERPEILNNHVTVLMVRLYLGPAILRVSWEHQKEKIGYSNSLMLLTYGLAGVEGEVGGILGTDDHKWAASSPEDCFTDRLGTKMIVSKDRCRVRASAFLSIEEAVEEEAA